MPVRQARGVPLGFRSSFAFEAAVRAERSHSLWRDSHGFGPRNPGRERFSNNNTRFAGVVARWEASDGAERRTAEHCAGRYAVVGRQRVTVGQTTTAVVDTEAVVTKDIYEQQITYRCVAESE